ncbi:head-tail connector protein [Aliamphritea hakodatensis]|uniref:head-tail connector protein n=1 Tax=Aliamphritea hakodatensis TaxID=2895352 RepID=UPI0022FD8151|nr:head-tail connector protein [Aliamphritea hakodatensis]
MAVTIKTEPVDLAVELSLVKKHCQIDDDITDDDDLLTAYIHAAHQLCQTITGRYFGNHTLLFKGRLSDEIELAADLQTVASVKYRNCEGSQQVISESDYGVSTSGLVGFVRPYGVVSDVHKKDPEPVTIEFVAGMPVPKTVVQAILLLVSHWYENRQAVGRVTEETEYSVNALLKHYRVINI